MFDLFITEETSEREILLHILKELKTMALDLSAVTTAITKVSTDVDSLITADAAVAAAVDAATKEHQAQVDALVAELAAVSTKAEAALTPPPPAA